MTCTPILRTFLWTQWRHENGFRCALRPLQERVRLLQERVGAIPVDRNSLINAKNVRMRVAQGHAMVDLSPVALLQTVSAISSLPISSHLRDTSWAWIACRAKS